MNGKRIRNIAFMALLLGLFTLPASIAFGATWSIPGNYANIQAAIDAAAVKDGDTLVVADRTYTATADPGFFNLDFGTKNLTLRSAGGAANCILDAENQAFTRFAFIDNPAITTLVIDGFTFRRGSHDFGGAIRIELGARATIRNCILENNTADNGAFVAGGGAINTYDPGTHLTIDNCIIRGNTALNLFGNEGGGVRVHGSSSATIRDSLIDDNEALGGSGGGIVVPVGTLTVVNSIISNNRAGKQGGGVAVISTGSSAFIEGTVISGNSAGTWGGAMIFSSTAVVSNVINSLIYDNSSNANGAAVDAYRASVNLINCTITENTEIMGQALLYAHYAGDTTIPTDLVVWNSILYNNFTGQVADTDVPSGHATVQINWSIVDDAGIAASNHNIDSDPLFANNFSLLEASPAIDAGDNTAVPAGITEDLDGATRFFDAASVTDTGKGAAPIVDLGAYEYDDGIVGSSAGAGSGGGGGGGGCFISSVFAW